MAIPGALAEKAQAATKAKPKPPKFTRLPNLITNENKAILITNENKAILNALLDQPIAPSAQANENNPGIATPIPPKLIIDTIMGLGVIDSLNGFAPWFTPYNTSFDATIANPQMVDDMNDQHIINFALVLEFLEVSFYRQNIETFFGFL